MNNPSYGFIKNLWCSFGKPFRNQLIALNDNWNYHIKKEHSPYRDIKQLLNVDILNDFLYQNVPVIIDGGASNGSTVVKFKQQFPNSTILAFEPVKTTGLEENLKDFENVHVFYKALGEENKEIEFNETEFSDTSSILLHRDNKIKEYLNVKEKHKVQMISLDDFLLKNHFVCVDVLKLDLQGYELNALKGAEQTLKREVKLVLVECSFNEFYIGQPKFCEIYEFMQSVGFDVWNIYIENKKGPISFFDVLFIKREKE